LTTWDSGDKVYLQNLGDCKNNDVTLTYGCGSGLLTISNPLGTKNVFYKERRVFLIMTKFNGDT
jgi:hypothetical protein